MCNHFYFDNNNSIMTNNKQSSVEMMWDEIDNLFPFKDSEELQKFCAILDKYKAMHKEEIEETARTYFHERRKLTPTQYYKETFGGEK